MHSQLPRLCRGTCQMQCRWPPNLAHDVPLLLPCLPGSLARGSGYRQV